MKCNTRMVVGASVAALAVAFSLAQTEAEAGRGNGPIVYVTSQGLFYDSIVTANPLPPEGPFQKLEFTGPSGFQTQYGPGDQGYVGGRWWVDENNNNMMDSDDSYFSCPLLGPGREEM